MRRKKLTEILAQHSCIPVFLDEVVTAGPAMGHGEKWKRGEKDREKPRVDFEKPKLKTPIHFVWWF